MTTTIVKNDGVASASALQGDGKIVVVGTSIEGFAMVLYNPNGSLDPTFGTGSKVTTRIGTGYTVR